jgi:hypothetical protein
VNGATYPRRVEAAFRATPEFARDVRSITLYRIGMKWFQVVFAGLAAMIFLQIHGQAGDDILQGKIVRALLNHHEPAVIHVGTNGVTSLEFPSRIEAIDGYGFSQTPGAGDAFQISYTKGTNYFSVRALKSGVTGNLTVILDQKVYSLFFEESSHPSFVNIFGPAGDGGSAKPDDREVALKEGTESKSEGLTFSPPPGDYLPTAKTTGQAGKDAEPRLAPGHGTDHPPQPAASPIKRVVSKKVAKKTDPNAEKAKEGVAGTQKPFPKKLFGWLSWAH